MARYVLIESRDPFENRDCEFAAGLALSLADTGNDVQVFLVQNGVAAARRGANVPSLRKLVDGRIEVLADDFSLRERGISPDRLAAGVRSAPLAFIIDRLADGSKILWH